MKLQSELGGGTSNNGASVVGVGETGGGDVTKMPKTPSYQGDMDDEVNIEDGFNVYKSDFADENDGGSGGSKIFGSQDFMQNNVSARNRNT